MIQVLKESSGQKWREEKKYKIRSDDGTFSF